MKKAFTAAVVLLTFTIAYSNNAIGGFYIFSFSNTAGFLMPVIFPAQNPVPENTSGLYEANPRPDTNSSKYFPLETGNTWLYEKFTGGGQYALVISRITKDTLISSKRYFYCVNFPSAVVSAGAWIRYDSLTSCLLMYTPGTGCPATPNETLLDNLKSSKNDTTAVCYAPGYRICSDTGQFNFRGFISYKLDFDVCSPACIERDYLKKIGIYRAAFGASEWITYNLKGCVISGNVYGDTSVTYLASGNVRYRDNNQPVRWGKVKAYKYNYNTGQIFTYDSALIQTDGTFQMHNLPPDSVDIMAYQDDELSDYVPGFHDTTIMWQCSKTLVPQDNKYEVNIYVYKKNRTGGNYHIGGHVYMLNAGVNSPPLENSRVYLKRGDVFINVGITLDDGSYRIDSLTPGLYTFVIDRFGFFPDSKQIYLTGDKDTVDFYLTKVSGVFKEVKIVPKTYNLVQNYPNPFNPVTTFSFDIPKLSDVKLILYDITGRQVIELINSRFTAGRYKLEWDASNYASGVYFYKLTADEFTETRRLVLVK
jgi:hypothetical protein